MYFEPIDFNIISHDSVLAGLKSEVDHDHITLSTASAAKKLFNELRTHPDDRALKQLATEVMTLLTTKLTRTGWKPYLERVCSAVRNFFVSGFNFKEAVSSEYLLLRSLDPKQTLALLDNLIGLTPLDFSPRVSKEECAGIIKDLKETLFSRGDDLGFHDQAQRNTIQARIKLFEWLVEPENKFKDLPNELKLPALQSYLEPPEEFLKKCSMSAWVMQGLQGRLGFNDASEGVQAYLKTFIDSIQEIPGAFPFQSATLVVFFDKSDQQEQINKIITAFTAKLDHLAAPDFMTMLSHLDESIALAKGGNNKHVLQVMDEIIEPFIKCGIKKIWESDPFTKETARDFFEVLSKVEDESFVKSILSPPDENSGRLFILKSYCVSEFTQDPLRAKPLLDKIERLGTWATNESQDPSTGQRCVKELIYEELGDGSYSFSQEFLIEKANKWRESVSAGDIRYMHAEFDKLFASINMIQDLERIDIIIKTIVPIDHSPDLLSRVLVSCIRDADGVDGFMKGKIGYAVSSRGSYGAKRKDNLKDTLEKVFQNR